MATLPNIGNDEEPGGESDKTDTISAAETVFDARGTIRQALFYLSTADSFLNNISPGSNTPGIIKHAMMLEPGSRKGEKAGIPAAIFPFGEGV